MHIAENETSRKDIQINGNMMQNYMDEATNYEQNSPGKLLIF